MDEQDKQFFREMLGPFGRNLDEKLDARFEQQAAASTRSSTNSTEPEGTRN
ncbi:MAG: hypothetical protein HY900_24545 [Deltaproteobacteria bacterium]|nr:hypothetical protein [Deltaproteobacteria bacterium]